MGPAEAGIVEVCTLDTASSGTFSEVIEAGEDNLQILSQRGSSLQRKSARSLTAFAEVDLAATAKRQEDLSGAHASNRIEIFGSIFKELRKISPLSEGYVYRDTVVG